MLRKIILFFLIVFKVSFSVAQTPDTPELCLVTVGSDSLVELKWHYNDITKIQGFIIKRIIYNGVDVVDGTLNNICIINDSTVTTYIDNSTEYSTLANPYFRAEEYSINAYLIRNDSVIFGNMTELQSSIFLTSQWNKCNKTTAFSWNKYKNRNVQKYVLLYKTNETSYHVLNEFSASQTTYTTSNLDTNKRYYFKIFAVLGNQNNCIIDTSVSNVSDIFTRVPKKPEFLTILNASVVNDSEIKLNFWIDKGKGLKEFVLYRNDEKISSFEVQNTPYFYIDKTDITALNKYCLYAIDSCDEILKKSNIVQNIILDVRYNDKIFDLEWSETTIFENDISFFEIFANFDNTWIEIEEQNLPITSTQISLDQIFGNNNTTEITNVKFQIVANPKIGIDDSLKTFSNIVSVDIPAIISIPNAFNPLSNIAENQYFTVKSLFVQEFHITIFTEKGTLLFVSDDILNSWNGKNKNGELLPQGAYIYHIEYKSMNGQSQQKNGIVNLVYP